VTSALDKINDSSPGKHVYAALLSVLDGLGPYEVEAKQTSLHVVHGRAFLGVHPRATGLLLNVVTSTPLAGERIRRTEQVSANRWHNEVLVGAPGELDEEVVEWIGAAYALTR
jgi:uncharacterized protein DUF5655